MSDKKHPVSGGARREFLKKAGEVAVTTPTIMLLLSAGSKNTAKAGFMYNVNDGQLDDPEYGPYGEDDGVEDGEDEDAVQ